jgi:methylglutaconyl-CoA hydratase
MITYFDEAYLKTTHKAGITTLEFFHPKSNSLPAKMLQALTQAFHSAALDKECRVIVLRSDGEKAFCAGAFFDELLAIKNWEDGFRFFSGFANVINAMRKCPQFIIGRIHGKCTGGGVGLAAACDYAISVEGADIKLSELAVGIGPFVVGPAVERKLGTSAFTQLAIDATMWRNSDWAKRKGLYAEHHPNTEGMDESIARLSDKLAHSNPDAIREMKKTFWKGTDHWDDLLKERAAISGKLVLSEFTRAAIQQFKKKN